MKLILVDTQETVWRAWSEYFDGLPNVEIVQGRFEQLAEFDCLVSPANSFGIMDGGMDAAILRFFGQQLQEKVREAICTEWLGEQPVGTSLLVETMNSKHPFLAHTPTMRIPMDIRQTDNVYKAMWAMLVAVHRHNQVSEKIISSVACSGLGTATGCVPANEAARQMAIAYKTYLSPPTLVNWKIALERQQKIFYGGFESMKFPMR